WRPPPHVGGDARSSRPPSPFWPARAGVCRRWCVAYPCCSAPLERSPPARRSRRHECRRLQAAAFVSDHSDVLGFLALAARGHVELDALTLFEGPIATA